MADPGVREVRPGGIITLQALGFPAGLVPKPSVRLTALVGGAVVVGPTTVGVTEDSPGNYDIQLTIPEDLAAGDYAAEWQFSGVWVRDDDIVRVTASPGDGYTTVTDLRATLNPTGEAQSGTASVLTDAELADAIARADAEIDGYLSGQYTVPLTAPVPSLVGQISTDLAAWEATLRYRRGVLVDPNDPVRLRAVEARKLLERISQGKIDLVGVDGAVATAGDAAVVNPHSSAFWDLASFGLRDPLG